MTNVTSIFGGPAGEREVVASAVESAEELLRAAQSGEVIGFAVIKLHHDAMTSWSVAGRVGGYSMIGAMELVKRNLMRLSDDE